VDAVVAGTKLGAVNSVSVTPSTGVTVSLCGTPADTSVIVHMVLDATAAPGPHTLTLGKPNGVASAAVFTVLAPPAAMQSGDLKKPYHDLFDRERQTDKAALTALVASVQQAVDQTLQQLQSANQGNVVDLGPATNNLNQQITSPPSLPKAGDTVQVRFRVRNDGTTDAKGVPIALQVNGVTVASDTFDVGAGRSTLAGLQWNSAAVPLAAATRSAAVRPQRLRVRTADGPVTDLAADAMDRPAGLIRVAAVLVIDPQHTVQQKTTLDKSAALAHFTMRGADSASGGATPGLSQRVLLEIQEGACAGLRLATGGVGPCGTADLELTIDDIAKGTYTLNSDAGVADLGAAFAGAAMGGARFSSELTAAAGHSYGVQLSGGRTARIMVDSIRNPNQLDAATRAVFRNSAVRVMRSLGSDSGPSAPGELAGGLRGAATVFVQLTLQVQ